MSEDRALSTFHEAPIWRPQTTVGELEGLLSRWAKECTILWGEVDPIAPSITPVTTPSGAVIGNLTDDPGEWRRKASAEDPPAPRFTTESLARAAKVGEPLITLFDRDEVRALMEQDAEGDACPE